MRSFRVVRDLQGGTFGMGRAYTAKEWAETAIEWLESDEADGNDIASLQNTFEDLLQHNKEKEVIDVIAEWWGLEFGEVIGKRAYPRP